MATAGKVLLALLAVMMGQMAHAEPEYCKRGAKVSAAYQHCFEEAHFLYPFDPLRQHHDVIDGCMVEAYATHVCRVVKPKALDCFRRNVSRCDYRDRILAIADESGGACYGNNLNREFKEHVLNLLEPVPGDSSCFILGDQAYACYQQAGVEMVDNNPDLDVLSVDEFMPVADKFFDSVLDCFIKVYKKNERICKNWQIPLLLELQGTALPSLFGMTFTPEQMDRLELRKECRTHHGYGNAQPTWRNCVNALPTTSSDIYSIERPEEGPEEEQGEEGGEEDWSQQLQQQQQQLEDNTLPPFLQKLRQNNNS